MFLSREGRYLGVAVQAPPGSQASSQGEARTPLSSRVATRVSWSPLSGLKGVQPSLPFGERTRHCSPGQQEKKALSSRGQGRLRGFLELRRPWGFSPEARGGCQGASRERQGSQVSMCVARGSGSWLSRHGRGLGPRDALKKDSRGLSRVVEGNPRFPRLLPGTLGNFPGCL